MAPRKTHEGKNCSYLFSPFRATGLITNDIPVCLQVRGRDHFVTTCVGKAFHIYNCAKLNLLFVGETSDDAIRCLGVHANLTVTTAANKITFWNRGKQVRCFSEHESDVKNILSFGEHMVSVDDENVLKIWDAESLEEYLTLNFNTESFDISTLIHPSTYLNKVLLGSRQGSMQLWNIKSNKCIYEFKGWNEPITTLVQAPAIDVVAVGLQSGRTILHNLKCDKTIMSLLQDYGPVTGISFRTDGQPFMAVASTIGHVSVWDLEKKQLKTTIRHAHEGLVSSLEFLQNQPTLLTSGPDNSLKLWIFDNPDGSARLLRSRSGHSSSPTHLHYYNETGNILLSAGITHTGSSDICEGALSASSRQLNSGVDRSLRYSSTRKDEQCCEMSQGSLVKKAKSRSVNVEELKLTPILCIASATTRERDWDNIVTCHQNDPYVRTWSSRNKAIGKHRLGLSLTYLTGRKALVATMTACGNFTVVGYDHGNVEMFNVQSGFHRGCFGSPRAHKSRIQGIEVDSVISTVVTCCQSGGIKFWDFKSKQQLDELSMSNGIVSCRMQRESSLLAVAFSDFMIFVLDFETRKIVRKLTGHNSLITDMSFSSDSRWLVSSGMDQLVKIWDVPSGRLIDCFAVDSPAVSVAMSPVGDYLATAHLDELGVYLWANKTLFGSVLPAPLPDDYEPVTMALPGTRTEDESYDEDLEKDEDVNMATAAEEFKRYTSPAQLQEDLVTLSMIPQSKWKTILNLDVIKARNKPKEPPKKPKAAPFFLPTTSSLNPEFIEQDESEKKSDSKVLKASQIIQDTKLQQLLRLQDEGDDVMVYLKNLSPSALDVEFRCLAPEAGGDIESMRHSMQFLQNRLKSGKDFELIESFIGLFMKLHATTLAQDKDLRSVAMELLDCHEKSWKRCEHSINQSLCLISFFKQAAV